MIVEIHNHHVCFANVVMNGEIIATTNKRYQHTGDIETLTLSVQVRDMNHAKEIVARNGFTKGLKR